MPPNPWVGDDPDQIRSAAEAVMETWKTFYPTLAYHHGNDDFMRLRATMRDLWKALA
jgi:hypothetical protein